MTLCLTPGSHDCPVAVGLRRGPRLRRAVCRPLLKGSRTVITSGGTAHGCLHPEQLSSPAVPTRMTLGVFDTTHGAMTIEHGVAGDPRYRSFWRGRCLFRADRALRHGGIGPRIRPSGRPGLAFLRSGRDQRSRQHALPRLAIPCRAPRSLSKVALQGRSSRSLSQVTIPGHYPGPPSRAATAKLTGRAGSVRCGRLVMEIIPPDPRARPDPTSERRS